MSDLGTAFTSEQWNRVRQIVHDEALRARVAASFLPLFGPLPGDTTLVPKNKLSYDSGRMAIVDYEALRLATVAVNVYIKNHMLADPDLTAATIMFRRAAEMVARVEDALIFNGRTGGNHPSGVGALTPPYTVSGSDDYSGLTGYGDGRTVTVAPPTAGAPLGVQVYNAVVKAVTDLETAGYYAPFACILSNELFSAINDPLPQSMVLPRESITPFLSGGPLLRSSVLASRRGAAPDQGASLGLVIALQGDPVEIVVPGDISVRFLHTTIEGEHAFRVSQRFVLRVKEEAAIRLLQLGSDAAAAG